MKNESLRYGPEDLSFFFACPAIGRPQGHSARKYLHIG